MSRARLAWLTAVAFAVLAIAAVATALFLRHRSHGPDLPPEMVPPAWASFRTSLGHEAHVGKAGLSCKSCHDFEREGFKNPGLEPCLKCHEKEGSHAHGGAVDVKESCLGCHAFAPEKTTPTCIGCHATLQGKTPPVRTHASAECTQCHTPHGAPAALTKDCSGCHEERATEHAKHTGSTSCADCHRPHAPARDAIATCAGCHGRETSTALHILATNAPAGAKATGHDTCLDCHKPHDFVARAPSVCIGCHGAKPTLLASTVPAHADCASCHAPHAPKNAAASCATCHSNVDVSHDDHDDCVGCHAPHEGNVSVKARTCTSCHAVIATSDVGAHAGGVACVRCHEHHDEAPPAKPGLCAGCHARETSSAAHNAGHAACATCHGASTHAPKSAPACGTCHKVEQSTAPRGHQKCTTCHDAHSGDRLPAATCASCHAVEATSAHAVVKGGCATCHEAHGAKGVAKPPACPTCHAPSSLPALHSVAAHVDCTKCHSSHAPPRADRATCTASCHADRKTHQPSAVSCGGCHVFRK